MEAARKDLNFGIVLSSVLVGALVIGAGLDTAAQGTATRLKGVTKVVQGQLQGVPGRNTAITVFKGVPYALPPVGPGRWRAPEPAATWAGVRQAREFSPECIQTIVEGRSPWTYEFMAHGKVSEDCLYLNIWTGAATAAERRPVLVYIHGGANTEGSGSVPVYDGEGLASKGLVVVTINYRLGIFGFLAHPELTAEAAYRASGNYGLLDQIAAVRWVHENITAFGGDPNRITVAGQSAGASAVHNLTASPLAKGLFHRAIAESGSSLNTFGPARTLADQESDGIRFASAKGARSLAELRALPWETVFAPLPQGARAAGAAPVAPFRWGTVVDGHALPLSVGDTFKAGRQNDVPTLTGSNADENGASPKPTATAETFTAQARQRYGTDAEAFLALYPAGTDEAAKAAANASARDLARVSTALWARERARTAKTATYTYFWSHPLPGEGAATYGAFHTSEVPYAMNALAMSPRPFSDADRRLADTLSSYWVNFATSGSPNGRGLPTWPSTTQAPDMTMEIGERIGPMPIAGSAEKLALVTRLLQR